jgi:hypothetical protein
MAHIIRDRREGGVAEWTFQDGGTRRLKTFTCSHCNAVVMVPERSTATEAGGWCGMCAKPVCQQCAGVPECVPFERRCDQMEARDRLHRQIHGEYR